MIDKKILIVSQNKFNDNNKKYTSLYGWFSDSEDTYELFWKYMEDVFLEAIFYDYSNSIPEKGFIKVNEELVDIVREKRPEYVLFYRLDEHKIQSETFEKIRSYGAKTVGYFGDDATELHIISKYLIPNLDYIVNFDTEEALEGYAQYGAKAFYVPSGANTDLFHKNKIEGFKYDVSFVGAKKYDRAEVVDKLSEYGIEVTSYGSGWDNGMVTYEEMNQIFNNSKINLNFTKTMEGKLHFKARTIEIPMSGGFMLTEYIPGIEDYYEIDKEVVCFYTIEECAKKIKYYLENEEERKIIAEKGWKRTLENYTWPQKFKQVFSIIEKDEMRNTMKGIIPSSDSDMYRRLGRKVIYAVVFYLAMGKGVQWKEFEKEARCFGTQNIKASLMLFVMKYSPYFIGKRVVGMCYNFYYRLG